MDFAKIVLDGCDKIVAFHAQTKPSKIEEK